MASATHVVVDGSNIATEGRSLPSLAQLDEAVRSFIAERPHDVVTVVVDATFGHRIDARERKQYDEAVASGELITPPAGAIGRGDAFVLQIADKANATVLSNDSFQEFHGQYAWLFDEGRLIGGKPVANVGWIFVLRSPVRGPTSRRSVRAAKKVVVTTVVPTPAPVKAVKAKASTKAAAKATEHTRPASKGPAPEAPTRPAARTRRRRTDSREPVNEPMVFIEFVGAHPVGSVVEGTVDRFSSHGAYVIADGARCYVALKALGDPPPKSAREVLTLGESRSFVVQQIDAPRRGIDLTPLGMISAATDSSSTDRSTEVREISSDQPVAGAAAAAAGRASNQAHAEEALVAPAKKTAAKKTAARKAPARKTAAKKTTAKKAPARKTAAKKAPARKAAAKKAPARKAAAKKTTARKTAAKKAPARKTAAKKSTARKSAAKKAPARKTAARKTTKRS